MRHRRHMPTEEAVRTFGADFAEIEQEARAMRQRHSDEVNTRRLRETIYTAMYERRPWYEAMAAAGNWDEFRAKLAADLAERGVAAPEEE